MLSPFWLKAKAGKVASAVLIQKNSSTIQTTMAVYEQKLGGFDGEMTAKIAKIYGEAQRMELPRRSKKPWARMISNGR